jgi:hypothetical protein
MLIGGQAVLVHGEPRLTQDIDLTMDASPERLDEVLAACSAAGLSPLPPDVDAFVRDTFVLPAADQETGIRVDLIFSNTAYEREAIARAVRVQVGDVTVPFASAEDLILHKLFAGRPRDLEDAAGVARRKGRDVDWSLVRRWAREFSLVPGREALSDTARRLEDDFGAWGP